MDRRSFLYAILAPFLVPLLPKDWRATKTLCRTKAVRFNPDFRATGRIVDGPGGISVNYVHQSGDFKAIDHPAKSFLITVTKSDPDSAMAKPS